ncbi:hypothetical protein HMPREF0629_00769 [Peptoniphilus sp. oral taxon 386 str. F0131]|nr:hypothetical protein HMPREF0629_00769 [Peptoniphilus sp. oral taxon 386 str. F0131]
MSSLFCPNCGNKISEFDNYCPNCGKNIKNVKVSIISNDPKDQKKELQTDDVTRIFKPLSNINGIDSTDELKNIIRAVDKKISENISDYEKKSKIESENTLGPKRNHADEIVDFTEKAKTDYKKEETAKVAKVTPKVKKLPPEDKPADNIKKEEPKKRSLKDMWHKFINEDDDEFSIFSSFDKETNAVKKESVGVASSSDTSISMEDTMGLSKVQIEEAIARSEKAEKDKHIQKSESEKKETTSKNEQSSSENEKPQSLSYKNLTDLVNAEIKKSNVEPEKQTLFSNFTKNKTEKNPEDKKGLKNIFDFKKEKNDTNTTTTKTEKINIPKEQKKPEEKQKADIVKNVSDIPKSAGEKNSIVKQLYSIEDKLCSMIEKFNSKMSGKNSYKIIALIAMILTALPVIISLRAFSISLIVVIIMKILLKLSQFYISLNITTDKAWIESSFDEVKKFSIVNWMFCEIFLFIAYIFSPWNGMFKFELLAALTPLPLATVILFLLSTLIAMAQYWPQLRNKSKVDFIAWYIIPFIILEFVSKFVFIFSTIFMS